MREPLRRRGVDALYVAVIGALTALAIAPLFRSTLLPFQDYPQILVFARALRDHADPASPFHGTYTTGFPVAPLVLPLLVLRGLWAVTSLESAGKIVWACHLAALPVAAHFLLRVLGRDRWAVLLLFPLVYSYWVVGGFFAYATSAPLVLAGLAIGLRWLERRSWPWGAGLAALCLATFLWHALSFALLVFDVGLLWALWRAPDPRARVRALVPLAPALVAYAAWMWVTVRVATTAQRPTTFVPFSPHVRAFFEFIGPIVPGAAGWAIAVGLLALASTWLSRGDGPQAAPWLRSKNPFAWLSLAAVVSYLALPSSLLGVEGIANRFPWWAAVYLVFSWSVPRARAPRAAVLALTFAMGATVLLRTGERFAAFDRESVGASRLIDTLSSGQTMFCPPGVSSTESFPGRPLVALDQYATIRHGGLPSSSFAGYDQNFIRYATGSNPMPQLSGRGVAWLQAPGLRAFDYVLLRGPLPTRQSRLAVVGTDGAWTLAAVCDGRAGATPAVAGACGAERAP